MCVLLRELAAQVEVSVGYMSTVVQPFLLQVERVTDVSIDTYIGKPTVGVLLRVLRVCVYRKSVFHDVLFRCVASSSGLQSHEHTFHCDTMFSLPSAGAPKLVDTCRCVYVCVTLRCAVFGTREWQSTSSTDVYAASGLSCVRASVGWLAAYLWQPVRPRGPAHSASAPPPPPISPSQFRRLAMVKRTGSGSSLKVRPDTPQKKAGAARPSGPAEVKAKCALARRVSKVRPSSDLQTYSRAVIERNSLIKIIDFLHDNPACAPEVWQAIDNGTVCAKSTDAAADSMMFADAPKKVSGLDVTWVANWIVTVAGGSEALKRKLDAADGADGENIHRLFCLATGTSFSTALPTACQHKSLCHRLFKDRYKMMGNRLQHVAKHITDAGVINWMAFAAYILKFSEEGRLISVKHCEGDVAEIPAYWMVDRNFLFHDPWLDFGSYLHFKSAKYTLSDLFADQTGPHHDILDKKSAQLVDMSKRIQLDLDAELAKKSKEEGADDDDFLVAHQEQLVNKRKEALAAARTKLQAAQSSRKGLKLS